MNCAVKKSQRAAIACSMIGYGITFVATYLGGHLVYDEQMSVYHIAYIRRIP